VKVGMKKVLCWKAIMISIALAMVALSIAYCPADDDKKPQEGVGENTFSLIHPSFVKTAQNGDKLW
jgi:hypothetical protein